MSEKMIETGVYNALCVCLVHPRTVRMDCLLGAAQARVSNVVIVQSEQAWSVLDLASPQSSNVDRLASVCTCHEHFCDTTIRRHEKWKD